MYKQYRPIIDNCQTTSSDRLMIWELLGKQDARIAFPLLLHSSQSSGRQTLQ